MRDRSPISRAGSWHSVARVPTVPDLPEPARPGTSRTALASLQAQALLELRLACSRGWARGPALRVGGRLWSGTPPRRRPIRPLIAGAVRAGELLRSPEYLAAFGARKRWMTYAVAGRDRRRDPPDRRARRGLRHARPDPLLQADAELLVVELDRPAMVEEKQLALATAKIARPWPRLVAVDLGDATALTGALAGVGWRPSEPALFVAELALEYLEPRTAFAMLRLLGTICGPRGRIALTIRFGDVVDEQLAAATAAAGEPMRFCPLRAELSSLLARAGLEILVSRGRTLGRTGAAAFLLLAPTHAPRASVTSALKATRCTRASAQGLDFLGRRQEPNGEFRIQLGGPRANSSGVDDHVVTRSRPRALCVLRFSSTPPRARRRYRQGGPLPARGRCGLPACGPFAWIEGRQRQADRARPRRHGAALVRAPWLPPAPRARVQRRGDLEASRNSDGLFLHPGSERRIGPTTRGRGRPTRTSCLRYGERKGDAPPLESTSAPACAVRPGGGLVLSTTPSTTPPSVRDLLGRSGTGSARSAIFGIALDPKRPLAPAAPRRFVRGRALHRVDPVDAPKRGERPSGCDLRGGRLAARASAARRRLGRASPRPAGLRSRRRHGRCGGAPRS